MPKDLHLGAFDIQAQVVDHTRRIGFSQHLERRPRLNDRRRQRGAVLGPFLVVRWRRGEFRQPGEWAADAEGRRATLASERHAGDGAIWAVDVEYIRID